MNTQISRTHKRISIDNFFQRFIPMQTSVMTKMSKYNRLEVILKSFGNSVGWFHYKLLLIAKSFTTAEYFVLSEGTEKVSFIQ